MYIDVINPDLTIFDGASGKYIGTSHFDLTNESKLKILDMLNYNRVPQTLTLQNLTLTPPTGEYVPPGIGKKLPRKAILTVDAIDASSGEQVPIAIRLKYSVQALGGLIGGMYDFNTLEMSNIQLVDKRPVEF